MEVDELIPISALQHVVFCPRQAALIHVERAWDDDAATMRGHIIHERIDQGGADTRGNVRAVRSLPLRHNGLGLIGVADVVELTADKGAPFAVRPKPIETKSGSSKRQLADDVQLCAQALCLEEAFRVDVPMGALYYASSKRRREVEFTPTLRLQTEEAIALMRGIIDRGELPTPTTDERKCRKCSLLEICMPTTARVRGHSGSHRRSLALFDRIE